MEIRQKQRKVKLNLLTRNCHVKLINDMTEMLNKTVPDLEF